MERGWVGKDGNAAKPEPKGRTFVELDAGLKAKGTDNGKQYNAAQGLKGVTGGYTVAPNGLRLSDPPPLGGSGQGIKMDHGIRTIGQGKGTQLLAAHPPRFGGHVAKGPSLHYTDARTGSSPVRAAGPKPKPGTAVPSPDVREATGVFNGVRTYNIGGPAKPEPKPTDNA
ncbi:MAG: hypothetical protein K8R69_07960 [Deltaproteobacteria bacterium]|nr:hypothetical protein [Deltaproteobacteria bacterium]